MHESRRYLFAVVAFALALSMRAEAGTVHNFKSRSIPTIQALRGGSVNHASNIEFWQTNFGELFLDISVSAGKAGTFWPRGHNFSYIFGGGFWFGTLKSVNGTPTHHVLVGYNPYNGGSWFQPGTVADAQAFYDSVKASPTGKGRYPTEADNVYGEKNTIFYSTDYDHTTGLPLNPAKLLPPWPIWDTDPSDSVIVGTNHYFGNFVDSIALRNTAQYPIRFITSVATHYDSVKKVFVNDTTILQKGGPAFISEEDMFTVNNELDTTYDLQKSNGRAYPLHVEVQRMIYSWASEVNKNYIFIAYKIINHSTDELDSCWLSPVMDPDIGIANNDENGFYNTDPSLNFAMQWSDKEAAVPFAANQIAAYPGVLGVDFLESPTVYKAGDSINGAPISPSLVGTIKPGKHKNSEQLGLVRFKRWEIGTDPIDDDSRYAFMTGNIRDTALNQFSDKRLLMSTGPFKLLPGQSAQVVVGVMIARDSANGDNNLPASQLACVNLDKRAQVVYDSNFRVPLPPSEPTFDRIVPLDGGAFIVWDSLAEFSFDPIGTGMDFLGYRLYRGRQDLSGQNGTTMYDQYQNPYGYRLVQQWSLASLGTIFDSLSGPWLPPDNAPAAVRQQYYLLLNHYMDSLTTHHSYYDFGDLNHDGIITSDEQLFNDVDYYYWMAAFDQGDSVNGVAPQQTNGKVGQSKVRIHPVSSYAGTNSTYQILSTQGMLGGLSNFQWRVQNQQIINQLLAGDTLTVSISPHLYDYPLSYREYGFDLRVQDQQKAVDITYPYYDHRLPVALYSASIPAGTYYPIDTSSAAQFKLDTIPFGREQVPIAVEKEGGLLRSDDTSLAPNQYLLNAIEHSMNYNFYQLVWLQRTAVQLVQPGNVKDTVYTKHADGKYDSTFQTRVMADTVWQLQWELMPYGISQKQQLVTGQGLPLTSAIYALNDSQVIHHTQLSADTTIFGLDPFAILGGNDTVSMYYDNSGNLTFDSLADQGQTDYVVQFTPGGIEYDTIATVAYTVPYLNLAVQGEQIYTVKDVHNLDSTVKIVYNMTPNPKIATGDTLRAGQWAMDPLVWKMSTNNNSETGRSKQFVGYSFSKSASPNRYYLTAHGSAIDTDYLVFANKLTIGGNKVFLDSANKMVSRFARDKFPGQFMYPSKSDFKVGDIARVRYAGGMLGMPTPTASFQTVFTTSVPQGDSSNISASELGSINVWPNPYIDGGSIDPNAPGLQKPAYGDKMVFNHLPPRCTITLFNIAGELIRTINHNGGSEDYWDLLSDGHQRVGSQLIVAEVKSTSGETRTLNIAVIVSGR